jgi:phosphohistidine phosphatase SixA
MLISCITHANARSKKNHVFLGLTEQGWGEVDSAAKQFNALIAGQGNVQGEYMPRVDAIISSPKARCLETAVLFAKAISDYGLVTTSEAQTNAALKAGSIGGDELVELANSTRMRHLLVAAHADLAKTLPSRVELVPSAVKDGWFTTRPVLFSIDHEAGEPWDQARVLFCEGYIDDEWRNLIQTSRDGRQNIG